LLKAGVLCVVKVTAAKVEEKPKTPGAKVKTEDKATSLDEVPKSKEKHSLKRVCVAFPQVPSHVRGD
jgi:hypothetical protein